VYANSINHPEFSASGYIDTIPLDRVKEIHLAGGQWIDGWYHDFHNAPVPAPVWDMLRDVLARATNVEAVVLEVQGPAHNPRSRPSEPGWVQMATADLQRAHEIWATRTVNL
jgi:uncharacterized protein (UPF0276 family)